MKAVNSHTENQRYQVSIILPTYNRAETLGRAIRSILEQTYDQFELIIVDDGSSDNTSEVVRGFNDSRIRFFQCQTNQGAAVARNLGIREAKYKIIAFHDSDDEWMPDKLERQVRVFSTNEHTAGVVYTKLIRGSNGSLPQSEVPTSKTKVTNGWLTEQLLRGNMVGTPTALVSSDLLAEVGGFDENLRALQDWELFIRLSQITRFEYIDKPLVYAYISKTSISSDKLSRVDAIKRITKKHRCLFEDVPTIAARWFYTAGDLAAHGGDINDAKKLLWKAVRYRPYHAKYIISWLAAMCGSSYMYKNITSIINKISTLKQGLNKAKS